MNRKNIIIAALALGTLSAASQINSPQSTGYEVRAAALLADGDFTGCLDQCNIALQLGSNRREQLTWLSAVAAFNGGLPEATGLVNAYIKQFPAGKNIVSARLMRATLVFYAGKYDAALQQFESINPSMLNDNEAEDLKYRKAYSLMKLADYDKALPLMQELTGVRRYAGAATFYCAYIAFEQGDFERAIDLFNRCDKTKSPGDMADYYVGQILFSRREYGDALNILMPLMTRKNISGEFADECQRIAGECFYALHDDNRAMVYLNGYMSKHGDDAPLSTRYIVGVERYQTGDYSQALELLAPVSKLTDEMGQSAALTMGQCYQALGNYKLAVISFDKATQLDFNPRLTEIAYYNYAVAQVDGGRVPFGNSVRTLEDFLQRYPDSHYATSVREYLVKGYMATDDYIGALKSLNSMADNHSAAMDAARQRVNFVLGTRALQSGNAVAAADYLSEAMKYGASDPEIEKQTSLWLGDAYYAQGKYRQAAMEYKSYMASSGAKDANRSIAQYNLGYAEFAERKYADARRMFANIAADKNIGADMRQDIYNRIGDTYYYEKQLADAKAAYQKAYDIRKSSGDYSLMQIAMMQGYQGDYDGKMKSLQQLVREFPKSSLLAAARTEMAMTHGVQGNLAAAIALYKQIAADYSSTQHGRNALLQLAILSDNNGETEAAKSYYRSVISDYPTSREAALAVEDLKRIYGDEGRIMELDSFLAGIKDAPQIDATERNAIAAASLLAKARAASTPELKIEAAEEILSKYPDAGEVEEALAISARAHAATGIVGKALERYTMLEQRASTAAMRHVAQLGILRAANDLGDTRRVLSVSQELLDNPAATGVDMPEVKFVRAVALHKSGDIGAALTLWQTLASEPADIYGTRSAYEIANHYFTAGDLDKAHETAEALIDANPPHAYWLARTFILYSDILRAEGSEFEADEYLRVLRSNYPGAETDIFRMIDKRLPQ